MSGDGERKLAAALEETLGQLETTVESVPALLGAYIDGQKTIVVVDQPDYVWCRIGGNESRRVKAFNSHASGVSQHWDLPIIIQKDKLNPNVWKVMGRDITRYPDWGKTANYPYSSPYIAHHGADHSFSSQAGMGADPVWVFKRQMMPMLPHPAVSGSMGIEIGSDFYTFGGAYRWFSSTGTVDFTSYLPTGASNGKFVTVYIDGDTGNPAYLDGGEFNAITPPIDPGAFISIPRSDQGVSVAAVFLLSGTAKIGWSEIYDLRHAHAPVPGTGTWIDLYDEASLVGSINEIHVEGNTVQAIVTGSVGYIVSTAQTVSVISGSFVQEEVLYDQALTSATGSIVFSPIPQDYDDLRLVLTGRIKESTGAGVGYEEIEYVWNGITGSVFSTFHWEGGSDGGGGSEHSLDNLTNSAIVGRVSDGQGTMTGTMSTIDMTIRDYTITGTQIAHDWHGAYHRLNLGVEEPFAQHGTQLLRNYEAPLTIRIKPSLETVNFEIGSKLKVTGKRVVWLPTSVSLT